MAFNATLADNASFALLSNNTSGGHHQPGCCGAQIKYATLASYLATFVVGLFGNGLVLVVITKFSKVRVRSVANYYIWNLAFADLLYILMLPLFCFATFTSDWIFGNEVCKIAYVVRECNKFASVFTLMALSVDRYLATHHNLSAFRTIRVGKIVCVGIWVSSLAVCAPYAVYSSAVEKRGTMSCRVMWGNDQRRKIWTIVHTALGLVVPLLIIITFNALLLRRIRSLGPAPSANRTSSRARSITSSMTKTVLVIVVLFMVCQIPSYAVMVMGVRIAERVANNDQPSQQELTALVYVNMVATILVFISSCSNPVVYGIYNKNYRDLYKQVLCCSKAGNLNRRPSEFRTSGHHGHVRNDRAASEKNGFFRNLRRTLMQSKETEATTKEQRTEMVALTNGGRVAPEDVSSNKSM